MRIMLLVVREWSHVLRAIPFLSSSSSHLRLLPKELHHGVNLLRPGVWVGHWPLVAEEMGIENPVQPAPVRPTRRVQDVPILRHKLRHQPRGSRQQCRVVALGRSPAPHSHLTRRCMVWSLHSNNSSSLRKQIWYTTHCTRGMSYVSKGNPAHASGMQVEV